MTKFLVVKNLLFILCIILSCEFSYAQEHSVPRFKAVAFDYFVIFNPNSVVPEVEKAFPGKGAEFTKLWRAKQFEYCYLRTITGRHADFYKVTDDALVYTAEAMNLDLSPRNTKTPLECVPDIEAMA